MLCPENSRPLPIVARNIFKAKSERAFICKNTCPHSALNSYSEPHEFFLGINPKKAEMQRA